MPDSRRRLSLVGVALAFIFLAPTLALAQTSITQAKALAGNITPGDAPGYPITISRTGSYRVDSSLVVGDSTLGPAVLISSPDVTIDFNGFSMRQTGESVCWGIAVRSLANGTTIRNGSIDSLCGIELLGSANRVERMVISTGDLNGISVGPSSNVLNNIVTLNRYDGIRAGAGSTIIGNIIASNDGVGIVAEAGSTVLRNTLSGNQLSMTLGIETGYGHNVIDDIDSIVIGGVQIGTNLCSGVTCP